jgi:predicted transcriptional regulator
MKQDIKNLATRLDFGIQDLLSVDAVLVKKYLIIYRLSKTHTIQEITDVFGYSNRQSIYSAIRKARGWISIDKEIQAMWEGLT